MEKKGRGWNLHERDQCPEMGMRDQVLCLLSAFSGHREKLAIHKPGGGSSPDIDLLEPGSWNFKPQEL